MTSKIAPAEAGTITGSDRPEPPVPRGRLSRDTAVVERDFVADPPATSSVLDADSPQAPPIASAGQPLIAPVERWVPRRSRIERWQELAREFPRIAVDPRVMGGEPRIEGTTITIAQIQRLAADGLGAEDIAAEFPGVLDREAVTQAFKFAARLLS